MSSDDLADFHDHQLTVTVETYQGKTGTGTISYSAPATVPGWLSRKQRLVLNQDAEQVLSSATFSAAIEHAEKFAPRSKVTIGDEVTLVLSRQVSDGGGFIEGLDRVKAWLQ